MRLLVATLFTALAATSFADEIDYEVFLNDLWNQTDVNKDGALSYPEVVTAFDLLDVKAEIFTEHEGSFQVLYDALNTDKNDGGLTKQELGAALTEFGDAYKDALVKAFTNGAGEAPDVDNIVTSDEVETLVTVTAEFSIDKWPIYPKERMAIKTKFAQYASVDVAKVFLLVQKKGVSYRRGLRQMSSRFVTNVAPSWTHHRKLTTTGADVEVIIFVEDSAAASATQQMIPKDTTTFQADLGLPVSDVPSVATTEDPPLPMPSIILVAIALILVGIFMCMNATFWSRRIKKAEGMKTGCCSTGCCSFNAVRAWAFSETVAGFIILGMVFYLANNMQKLTDVIIALVDIVLELANSQYQQARELGSSVPEQVIDVLTERKSLLELLPVAVMVPGILAAVCLLLASLCPHFTTRNIGSYMCTKCFIMISHIFLLLSFVFYIIFAAFALAIKFAPPALKTPLNLIDATCLAMPAVLKQSLVDNKEALDKLTLAGQNTTEAQDLYDAGSAIVSIIDRGCGYVMSFIDEMIALFLPGLLCVVAIAFAMFVNQTLCCAAGCCSSKSVKAKAVESSSSASASSVSV